MTLLEVSGLVAGYRLGTVLHGVDLEVPEGDAIAILGRNGVGKSTLVHAVTGLLRPRAGSVRIDGRELAGRRADVLARAGVGLVPQGRRVFAPLTVREHLSLAEACRRRDGPWSRARVLELFPRLGERLDHPARHLSGGEQQMLAVTRALMSNPRLLVLDEPSEGLAPAVVRQLADVLGEIRADGRRRAARRAGSPARVHGRERGPRDGEGQARAQRDGSRLPARPRHRAAPPRGRLASGPGRARLRAHTPNS